ncbi:hypothetical protein SHJJP8921_000955 [Staphylococcus lugdunensis]|uniref:hypothetical protein n=1 Tax=Staphylococcus lugdunensis TaxID=28035 RepID=UPI001F4CEE88|nr:hypothetical protein [Staphylococcus lugdunensis]MCH8646702.1 hypothetical protein [Staphylococcus lugdunensis]
MLAILKSTVKFMLKFLDFEKKWDYYFMFFLNSIVIIGIFGFPLAIEIKILLNLKNDFLEIMLIAIVCALILSNIMVWIVLIQTCLNFFIIYRDLQGRWFIKRGLNRKFYENRLRLDTVEDINKELASKNVDYPLRALYKCIHYRYYDFEGNMYEEIACIFSKLHMIRMHLFSHPHKKKKLGLLILTFMMIITVCISYITGGSPIFLNRIIPYAQCVYCLISIGILAFINDDLITENNRAKILVIRYFQQRNNNKRNF